MSQSGPSPEKPLSKEKKGRFVLEKIMILMGILFFGGTIALTVIPAPYNSMVVGLVSILTIYVIFGGF
jgi:preprotein translocase subunit SecG